MSHHSRDQQFLASPRDTRHRRASSPGRFGGGSPHTSPGRHSGRSPNQSPPSRLGSGRRSPYRDLSPSRHRGRNGSSPHESPGRSSGRSPHHSSHISPHHSPHQSSNSLQSPCQVPERRHSYSRVMDQQRERESYRERDRERTNGLGRDKLESFRNGRGMCVFTLCNEYRSTFQVCLFV